MSGSARIYEKSWGREDVKLASQDFDDSPGPLAPIAGSQIRSNGTRHHAQRSTVRASPGCLRWQEELFLCRTPAHPDMPKNPTVAALCLALQQHALRPTRRDMPIIGAEHHLAPVLTLALVSRIFDVAFARLPSPAYPRGPVGRLKSHALSRRPRRASANHGECRPPVLLSVSSHRAYWLRSSRLRSPCVEVVSLTASESYLGNDGTTACASCIAENLDQLPNSHIPTTSTPAKKFKKNNVN
jgi:hypothetical protein